MVVDRPVKVFGPPSLSPASRGPRRRGLRSQGDRQLGLLLALQRRHGRVDGTVPGPLHGRAAKPSTVSVRGVAPIRRPSISTVASVGTVDTESRVSGDTDPSPFCPASHSELRNHSQGHQVYRKLNHHNWLYVAV